MPNSQEETASFRRKLTNWKTASTVKTRYWRFGQKRLTCTAGTFSHIVVARPDGEAFLYNYAPKLGVVGMDKVAALAVHREQSSPNRAINVSVSQVVRMAQILTPDTSQVKGSSWSGKVPLTEDQLEELYQIGSTGALSFSFEDHSFEDHLV